MFAATHGGGVTTTGWDVTRAAYSGNSLSVSGQLTGPYAMTISPDGTKLYVGGNTAKGVYQYTLTSPFNLSGASYASKSASISQSIFVTGVQFSTDGTKMYVGGFDGSGVSGVYQYTLSTAWDVSTATYASKSFSLGRTYATIQDIWFSPDGANLFFMSDTSDAVERASLSTPWDLSTASAVAGQTFSLASQETNPYGLFLTPSMNGMYVVGATNKTVYQYSMSTPGNLTTAAYTGKSFSVLSQTGASPDALTFGNNGTRMYVLSDTNDAAYQYNL